MKKELVREVKFGKAVAKITVTMFTEKNYLDGIDMGTEKIITTTEIEIIVGGKVFETGRDADILEYNNLTDTLFEKGNLDPNKKYTRVGDKALTLGDEAGIEINAAIEEMKAALAAEFDTKTEKQIEKEEEIEEAQAIVEQAEKEGIENLMTANELKQWRKTYNEIHNEGGEGYIPIRISKERYEKAVKLLQ